MSKLTFPMLRTKDKVLILSTVLMLWIFGIISIIGFIYNFTNLLCIPMAMGGIVCIFIAITASSAIIAETFLQK